MNDNELARIYYDHHAIETDRRSQRRLTRLMQKAKEHDAACTTEGCPVTLHAFIAGDVVQHTAINETFLELDMPEDDEQRQQRLNQHTFLRIYFPRTGQAHNGVMVETKTAGVIGR